jgi:hypothetical protein
MDLHIKHKYEEAVNSPENIFVRGYNIPVKSEKSDFGSELQLWEGRTKLGGLLYSVNSGVLHIDHLYAEDMVNSEGTPKPFRSAPRNSKRVPVGSILIGAVKAVAKENGFDTVKTVALPNSRNFYKKMGFNNRGVFQTRSRSRSRSRNRTRRN